MANKKARSPKYPSFGLEEAIAKLESIHQAHGPGEVDRATLANTIGYQTPRSGVALRWHSTLMQFGLLEPGPGGNYRVSELGRDVLFGHGADRLDALRRAAEAPQVFQQIRQRFSGTEQPEKQGIESMLQREKFTPYAAPLIAQAYLKTAGYMGEKLVRENPDLSPPSDGIMAPVQQQQERAGPMPTSQEARTWISGPLPGGATFSIIATEPISADGLSAIVQLAEANLNVLNPSKKDEGRSNEESDTAKSVA